MGTNGLSRQDPDRFAFGIVNVALGGGMSSRLFQEVREKRGLCYSIYAFHWSFSDTGVFATCVRESAREIYGYVGLLAGHDIILPLNRAHASPQARASLRVLRRRRPRHLRPQLSPRLWR